MSLMIIGNIRVVNHLWSQRRDQDKGQGHLLKILTMDHQGQLDLLPDTKCLRRCLGYYLSFIFPKSNLCKERQYLLKMTCSLF